MGNDYLWIGVDCANKKSFVVMDKEQPYPSLRGRQMSEQNLSWYGAELNSSEVIFGKRGSSSSVSWFASKCSTSSYSSSENSQSNGVGREFIVSSDVMVEDEISKSVSSSTWNAWMSSSSWPTVGDRVNRREISSSWWLSVPFLFLISRLNSARRKSQRFRLPDDSVMLNS